jgi:hypothetical protein
VEGLSWCLPSQSCKTAHSSFPLMSSTNTFAHFIAPLATSTSPRFSSPPQPQSVFQPSLHRHHGSPISPYPFSYRDHSIHRSRVFPSSWRKHPGRAVQYHYEPFLGRILHLSGMTGRSRQLASVTISHLCVRLASSTTKCVNVAFAPYRIPNRFL